MQDELHLPCPNERAALCIVAVHALADRDDEFYEAACARWDRTQGDDTSLPDTLMEILDCRGEEE